MAIFGESWALAAKLLYGQAIPSGYNVPLIILGIYIIYLVISGLILYFSVKLSGSQMTFMQGFPTAIFTTVIRDLIALPLIFIVFIFPFVGLIFAIVVWLGLIKFMFQIPWWRAIVAWIISIILPLVIAVFILIPIAMLLGVI